MSYNRELVTETAAGIRQINDMVEYGWYAGCSPTAVAMVMGYYDRNGYNNLITGDSASYSQDVKDAIASQEHLDNYANPRDTHGNLVADASEGIQGDAHDSNSIADFLHTSRSDLGQPFGYSPYGMLGIGVHGYATHRGYDDFNANYTRWSDLNFADIANEIDNGRPVILTVDSDGNGLLDHAIVAFGYDANTNKLLIHDGWNPSTTEEYWIDFAPTDDGHSFGIASACFIQPGDANGPDGNVDFLQFFNDGEDTAATYQSSLNDNNALSAQLTHEDNGINADKTIAIATANGHSVYALRNDGLGDDVNSATLLEGITSGDGKFVWYELSQNCGISIATNGFATADGRTFYHLYNDNSGSLAVYLSTRQDDGTFSNVLLNADSGLDASTMDIATVDGINFYVWENDGVGTAALYEATIDENGNFSKTLINADSGTSFSDVGLAAWNTQLPSDGTITDPEEVSGEVTDLEEVPGEVMNVENETQYLEGDSDNDVFVISDVSSNYGWSETDDGGIVIWSGDNHDIIYNFEEIRFTDQTIVIADEFSTGSLEVNDVKNETQYLQGTDQKDTFVINGNSDDYGWSETDDGGIVIWNGDNHDIIYNFEEIRFTDQTIVIADEFSTGSLEVNDVKNETQYLQGTDQKDTFVINGNSDDYGWSETDDGGVVVWNESSHDILYDFEELQFNDQQVSIELA